ncbi:helix-turn-helix domain-containing protein [Methylobacterium sp. NEAU 140]|uniref:helix-turn-helix domain-containing protein n=1 Tax=Methylobacterium sp. NEAU 140 TaxID=3064945 RepID=UPI0027326E33|nr:helix-turn-helix domain-containing protein [Methylobacterium sp. NEAU 140]MDP4027080.1 helix-turn-helix domain-containing protein [Methylobacterium sp. NEAU 140]
MTAGLETFAKVRALHDATTHPGERASAAARMKTLARKAGMTVAEAVSKLDAPPVEVAAFRTVNMADFFDTPYFREQKAQRERERSARWREVLEEYGTEEAVFEPGPIERALDEAAARYAAQFGPDRGWDAYPLSKVPAAIVATVEAAWPMPATVRGAWEELAFWDKLCSDREARGSACGDQSNPVQIRCRLLERMLDETPALSLNDLRARVSWFEHLDRRDARENGARLATLRADIERMGQRIREQDAQPVQDGQGPHGEGGGGSPSPSVQSGHLKRGSRSDTPLATEGYPPDGYPQRRTNADKRRDVLALLDQGLTDREIARRAGVSPTTVGTIRRTQP